MSERKERANGFYFVKVKPDTRWEIMDYSRTGSWFALGTEYVYSEGELHEIDERRVERKGNFSASLDATKDMVDFLNEIDLKNNRAKDDWRTKLAELKGKLKDVPNRPRTLDRSE
jgi:hypothetical protein